MSGLGGCLCVFSFIIQTLCHGMTAIFVLGASVQLRNQPGATIAVGASSKCQGWAPRQKGT